MKDILKWNWLFLLQVHGATALNRKVPAVFIICTTSINVNKVKTCKSTNVLVLWK